VKTHHDDHEVSGFTRRRRRREDGPVGTLLGWWAGVLIAGSFAALAGITLGGVFAALATRRVRREDQALRGDLEQELAKILRHPTGQEHPNF